MTKAKLLNPKEAAARLNISPTTLATMRRDGRIPEGKGYIALSQKVIRYREDWVEAVASGRLRPVPEVG